MEATPWETHVKEREENKKNWEKKPRLQKEYGGFYESMRAEMVSGPSLEIGSGMGNIKRWIPDVVTSEKDPSPDVDRQESAYALGYEENALGNILALDVWHHLEFPERALGEWRRCLRPGGRIILMEPGMGLLGQGVYGVCHHEPVGWKIPFRPAADWREEEEGYFACQSSAHRHFVTRTETTGAGWKIQTKMLCRLAYLTTGGFSKPELGPAWVAGIAKRLEPILEQAPGIFGTRLLVVLEKTA